MRKFKTTPKLKESNMSWSTLEGNWSVIERNWKLYTRIVKSQWGKLTDEQLIMIGGKREQLSKRIQLAYGLTKQEADVQIRGFEDRNTFYIR
jgi:uncharacterized protein YjbJ (UPF0337 family)